MATPRAIPTETAFEFQDTAVGGHGRGKVVKFEQGIADHAEVGVTDGTLRMLKIFPQLKQPVHVSTYHKRCEN